MQKDRWQKIEDIFNRSAALPIAERQAFVESSCEDDPELCREILLLISADDAGQVFLDESAFSLGVQLLKADDLLLKDSEFASYRIQKLLGRGGMGAVYLAEDTRLVRLIALKILPPSLGANTDGAMRFRQEALTASSISHPNVAHIYEFGEEGERYFLAMEYVEGNTLRQLLKQNAVDVSRAVEIALQIADALVATHKRGIVHRDIKPENIIVTEAGLVKVLDFGVAKLSDLQTETSVTISSNISLVNTTPGMVMGTIGYISPEQLLSKKVDFRADIWSLGVVLYEMLTGRKPFESKTPEGVRKAILKKKPAPLVFSTINSEVETALKAIIAKTLQKDVAKRYVSAADLANDLKDLRAKLEFKRHIYITESRGEEILAERAETNEQARKSTFLTTTRQFWGKQSFSRKALFLSALIGLLTFSIGVAFQINAIPRILNAFPTDSVIPNGLEMTLYFDYEDDSDPGLRKWYRIDDHRWVERKPQGSESVFDEIEEITVGGEKGIRFRNIVTSLEVFIPYQSGEGRTVYWRRWSRNEWLYLAKAVYINDQSSLATPKIN